MRDLRFGSCDWHVISEVLFKVFDMLSRWVGVYIKHEKKGVLDG